MGIVNILDNIKNDNEGNSYSIKVYTTTGDLDDPEKGGVYFLIEQDKKTYSLSVCVNDFSNKWMHNFIRAFLADEGFRKKFQKGLKGYIRHGTVELEIDKKVIEVDEKIAMAIKKLNNVGAKTEYCCQGGDEDSQAYISLKSGKFPKELVSAWEGADFYVSKNIVRAYSYFGMDKQAAILFQESLNDWINGNLDISGKKYKINTKRPNSLPELPNIIHRRDKE